MFKSNNTNLPEAKRARNNGAEVLKRNDTAVYKVTSSTLLKIDIRGEDNVSRSNRRSSCRWMQDGKGS